MCSSEKDETSRGVGSGVPDAPRGRQNCRAGSLTPPGRYDMCKMQETPTEEGAVRSLRRPAIVDFNQADASAVVQSREQRGVKARRQCRGYAPFLTRTTESG